MSSPSSSRSVSPRPSTPPQYAGSLGRTGGRRLKPIASMETLGPSASHPLLQPSDPPERPAVNGLSPPSSTQYTVNYKPRQRPTSVGSSTHLHQSTLPPRASTSTSTALSAPSLSVPFSTKPVLTTPQTETSQATSRLQLQNLQAAVQALGLDNDASGWILLVKLLSVAADPSRSEEWEALFADMSRNRVYPCPFLRPQSLDMSRQVTLLLPRESLSSTESVTAHFIADHAVVSDPSPSLKDQQPVVTLSGLRGVIEGWAF
jgi:hypothetical protein